MAQNELPAQYPDDNFRLRFYRVDQRFVWYIVHAFEYIYVLGVEAHEYV